MTTLDSELLRVLVIGGRGFVGSHIVRALAARNIPVHVFGLTMATDLLADLDGRFGETVGSVEDRPAILAAIEASGATAIVTTAAFGEGAKGLMHGGEADADRAMAINVDGLRHVLEAAQAAGVRRVITTGSSVVFGPADSYDSERVDETGVKRPRTIYGLTKVLSEDLVQYYRDRHGLDASSIRLPIVLGPGLWYQGAASAIAGVIANAAPGVRHQVRFHDLPIDLMHVSDVARAIVEALVSDKPLEAIYHINGFTARLSEISAAAAALVADYVVEQEIVAPANTFPLMDDSRFRARFAFVPEYDLNGLLQTQIAGDQP
ncbi:MAG: NAD(P)-dependent oxidoreductase [Devosia sp.]|nr:NAD(P)-dependent oxidoreductase [Devosia sp.]